MWSPRSMNSILCERREAMPRGTDGGYADWYHRKILGQAPHLHQSFASLVFAGPRLFMLIQNTSLLL